MYMYDSQKRYRKNIQDDIVFEVHTFVPLLLPDIFREMLVILIAVRIAAPVPAGPG